MLNPVPGAAIPTTGILSFGYKRSATHTHRGIDIRARKGSPVVAVASGVVERAHTTLGSGFSGYGRVVVIKGAKGRWFLYAHLDRVLVRRGQQVTKGQQIGTVGNTCFRKSDPQASCSGPHLHFEVSPRRYPQQAEASRLDPVAWLGGGGGIGIAAMLVVGLGAWLWSRR